MPTVKVFAPKADYREILKTTRLVEKYDAFVVVDASDKSAAALAHDYPVEDITTQFEVHLAPGTKGKVPRLREYSGEAHLPTGPHHYIVQFIGPIKAAWLKKVTALGATLRGPHSNFAQVVLAREAALPKLGALPFVRWVGHLPHAARIGQGGDLPRTRAREGVLSVEIFDKDDAGKIAGSARKLGFKVLDSQPRAHLLILSTEEPASKRSKQIRDLSAVHGVKLIRDRVVKRPSNDVATVIMGNAYTAAKPTGLKLSGRGEIVAVCDTGLDSGDPATIHPDFAGRVVAIKSYPMTPDWNSYVTNPGANDGAADLDSGHGTHTSGSVVGNGAASTPGTSPIQAHAHEAKLVFQAIEQEMKWKPSAPANLRHDRYTLSGIPADLKGLFQFAYDQGARVHSNSWGGGDPGAYDDQCGQFDQFVWDHKDFCFVIAAGNDGTDSDGDGKINLGSVSSPGTAKNCITVGACENQRPDFDGETYGAWWQSDFPVAPSSKDPMADDPNQVVAFSSRGPTTDGRIKPEVIAPGTFILSTRSSKLAPNNFAWAAYPPNRSRYFYMGGTSMATPLTAGAVTLLREFLRKKRSIASPSAALLKALLVAGAVRLPKTAPVGALLDNHQGFGRVNLDRSVRRPLLTVDGPALQTGQKSTYAVKVSSTATLRVVMSYSDYPGHALVNNLNLIVTDPAGKRYLGNQGASTGVLTLDANNNTEVVEVRKAAKGTWTVDVTASNVGKGPQDFALAAVLV